MLHTTQYRGSDTVSETGGQMWPPLCCYMCVYISAAANESGTSTLMHEGLPQ